MKQNFHEANQSSVTPTSIKSNNNKPNDQKTGNQAAESVYSTLSINELIRIITTKDKCITEMASETNKRLTEQREKLQQFKLKLEEEMEQNQKAVKAFGNITQIIISIIGKFQGFEKFNRQSIASIVGAYRQSLPASSKSQNQKAGNTQFNPCQSQYSCLDEIIQQTIRLLEYLGKLTQDSLHINLDMKERLKKMNIQLNNKSNQLKLPTKPVDQQIKSLNAQLNEKMQQVKNLKKLLDQQQQQRIALFNKINNSIDIQMQQKINVMNKTELIEQIKKMNFKIKELEKDKRDTFAKNKVERQEDYKKFQDMLKQIKQIKTNQNNKSAY